MSIQKKYTVFPIEHPELWSFYKRHLASFWTVEEVFLVDDLVDWENLEPNEQFFIKNVLAFFAASDGIVNENLVENFYKEVNFTEAKQFYAVQIMMEAIHSEQYSLLIDTYIRDTAEKNQLLNAVQTNPAIREKAEWCLRYANSDKSLSERLIAFVCVEGIFFSGSFCAIYWLKSRGVLPGLCTANEFIARDESLHAEFAIQLVKVLGKNVSKSVVHAVFKDAVEIETKFITVSLPVSLLGMNSELMTRYIEFVADRWLVQLGYPKLYNSENPFNFMELISLNTKTSFFEARVTEYNRANVNVGTEENEIGFDSEF